MKRILCFGDSNTWGYVAGTGERFPEDVRWTGVLQNILGPEYKIIEDGINGRTTVLEHPYLSCRSGVQGIGYSLLSARPVDLVVVMLGTNDLIYTNAYGYYRGLTQIVNRIVNAPIFYRDFSVFYPDGPRLLLVSPITLHPDIVAINPEGGLAGKYAESCELAHYTARVAAENDVPWVDAAPCANASEVDGIHLTAESHRAIGELVAAKIKEIL